MLIAEVADSTLRSDLAAKTLLYARVGIPEYLILDIAARQIVRHRRPTHEGYTEKATRTEDETLTILGRSEAVRVGDQLAPQPAK